MLSSEARGTLANERDKSIGCKGGPNQQFYETWEGHVPPLPQGSYVFSQMAVILSK